MKKITLLVLLLGGYFTSNAQAVNEVKLNILNTMIIQSVEVGYEHFIDKNQSVGVDFMINDRFSYFLESKKNGKKFKTNSAAVSYNYYLGGDDDENGSGYNISPFLKFRLGKFEEYKKDENGNLVKNENEDNIIEKTPMNSLIIGIGGGYKWALGDAFTVQPFANIGRNFSSKVNERFWGIELNAGVNIGYRF